MQEYLEKLVENFVLGIPNVLMALVIFIASLYLARLMSKLLHRLLQSRHAPVDITHLLGEAAFWTIVIVGLITALQRFFDVTAFLAGLGILGFAVGFALQDIMKNFAAGIILLLQHPFRVGDHINAADFEGSVLAIDLRTTEIKTLDGRIVILPNADVLTHPIINHTRAYRRRIELPLSVPQGTDPDAARSAVLQAIHDVPGFVNEPAPVVVFHSMTSAALDLTAYFWIDISGNTPMEAKDAALMRVRSAFSREGIEVPHPVQTVYFQGSD